MAEFPFEDEAQVRTADSAVVGVVKGEAADGALLVEQNSRLLRLSRSLIDYTRSTYDAIVLLPEFRVLAEHSETEEVPILAHAEQLTVDVREVEKARVRIQKSIEHEPVQEDIELGTEIVNIERVPSGEEYDEMPKSWYDGETLVIPVVEEILVITRRYLVVENVLITRRRVTHTEHIETELRREVVTVREEDSDGTVTEH